MGLLIKINNLTSAFDTTHNNHYIFFLNERSRYSHLLYYALPSGWRSSGCYKTSVALEPLLLVRHCISLTVTLYPRVGLYIMQNLCQCRKSSYIPNSSLICFLWFGWRNMAVVFCMCKPEFQHEIFLMTYPETVAEILNVGKLHQFKVELAKVQLFPLHKCYCSIQIFLI